jgi:hypothetical protein
VPYGYVQQRGPPLFELFLTAMEKYILAHNTYKRTQKFKVIQLLSAGSNIQNLQINSVSN